MITRINACETLRSYIGAELAVLAEQHNVTIVGDSGKVNKGWKGITLERAVGLKSNSRKAPNGLGWELKAVAYHFVDDLWFPKETMAIAMVNYEELAEQDFFHSYLWEKMKSMIFCPVSWDGEHSTTGSLLKVTALDFLTTNVLITRVKADYDFIRNKLRTQGKSAITSKDGDYVQVRTKGAGHGSVTKAFYAKKAFLNEICPPFAEIQQVEAA